MIQRRHARFSFRKSIFLLIMFFGISSIGITLFYTIPQLGSFLWENRYISPLAANFSPSEALGTEITQDMIKEKLGKRGFSVKEIADYDNGYLLTLSTDEKIIFSKNKQLDEQISSLQLISSRLTIEGKDFVQVDLRFDRPVIVPK